MPLVCSARVMVGKLCYCITLMWTISSFSCSLQLGTKELQNVPFYLNYIAYMLSTGQGAVSNPNFIIICALSRRKGEGREYLDTDRDESSV